MGNKQYTTEKIGDKYTVARKEKTFFGVKERFICSVAYEYSFNPRLWFSSFHSKADYFSFEGNTFPSKREADAALSVCVRLQV